MSLAIFTSATASVRSSPDRLDQRVRGPPGRRSGRAPRSAAARGRWARRATTAAAKPGRALSPVPTAVPPSGSSPDARTASRRMRVGRVVDLGGVAAELLAEGHRRGVHEVGAARLHHLGELVRLRPAARRAGARAPAAARVSTCVGRGDVDGRREHVVRRLRRVDVVVGVDRPARAARVARRAMTSLAFMFELVPEPVWNTSIGNWSSWSPAGHLGGGRRDGGRPRRRRSPRARRWPRPPRP